MKSVKSRSVREGLLFSFAFGGLTLAVMLGFFWLTGTFFPENMNGLMMSPARITGMALTYSTTPAFLLATLIYSENRTRFILGQLVNSGRVTRAAAASHGAGDGGIGAA